jgi:hypothetical protein
MFTFMWLQTCFLYSANLEHSVLNYDIFYEIMIYIFLAEVSHYNVCFTKYYYVSFVIFFLDSPKFRF